MQLEAFEHGFDGLFPWVLFPIKTASPHFPPINGESQPDPLTMANRPNITYITEGDK